MEPVLLEIGGRGLPLCFAHANGYPPGSYRRLFDALTDHFEVAALEHRPLWGGREPPRHLRWELFAEDMLAALKRRYDGPVWVMGHSMGGTVAVLAALREPQRFAGLILLDPVFLPDRIVMATRLMTARRRRELPLLRRALNRPHSFSDHDAAFDFYRSKRAFQGLNDEALRDYVLSSKAPDGEGGLVLRYSGEWEAAVYGSLPRVRRALKKLRTPTIGLRGRDSDTLRRDIFQRWAHWQPEAFLTEVPGGHLFPLEHPVETASVVREQLFAD